MKQSLGSHAGRWIAAAVLVLLCVRPASAQTYYVATDGDNDNPGTAAAPWRDISFADDRLQAGDTLVIRAGVYYDALLLENPGTPEAPIVVRAEADGQVIIDGEYERRTARIYTDWTVVEGLVFLHSAGFLCQIDGDHNVVRRCSGYYGPHGQNVGGFHITDDGHHNLYEDCIAGGVERHLFVDHSKGGKDGYNTFRRCFAAGWKLPEAPYGSRSGFNLYGVSHTTIENGIAWGPMESNAIAVHSAAWTHSAQHNRVLGTLAVHSPKAGITTGYGNQCRANHFENVVLVGNAHGIVQHHDPGNGGEVWRNITIAHSTQAGVWVLGDEPTPTFENVLAYDNPVGWKGAAPRVLRYSSFDRHGDPPWPANAAPGTDGNRTAAPGRVGLTIPADAPLKGAGRGGADIGANIFYRYVDGELTDEPLWPWPMADRLKAELGFDIEAELAALFGPVVPPGAPAGAAGAVVLAARDPGDPSVPPARPALSVDEALRERRQQFVDRMTSEPRLRAALLRVPRHLFGQWRSDGLAYTLRSLLVGNGQAELDPAYFVPLFERLDVRPSDRILQLGSGAGYLTALLAELGQEVWVVERDPAVARRAAEQLRALGYGNITIRTGDPAQGWPDQGPFDVILVSGAAATVPPRLAAQLADGGRMAVVLGRTAWDQHLVVIEQQDHDTQVHHRISRVSVAPLEP